MTILYVLVPLAIGIVLIAVVGFVWATHRGQFDDLETPALRMLRDEPANRPPSEIGKRPGTEAD